MIFLAWCRMGGLCELCYLLNLSLLQRESEEKTLFLCCRSKRCVVPVSG